MFGSSGRNFNAAQRVIGSPEVQAKLQPLFDNPGQFRLFKASLEREAQLFEESNRVLGGSQTGKRMQMRENLEEGPGVGEAISSAVTSGFWPSLTGMVARSIRSTEMTEKTASKMADMLMSKDPHQVAAVVKLLDRKSAVSGKSVDLKRPAPSGGRGQAVGRSRCSGGSSRGSRHGGRSRGGHWGYHGAPAADDTGT